MGKKLLFLIILLIAYLSPEIILAQCPSSVTLTSDPGTNVCEETPITFKANTTAGSGLTYQWELNGSPIGTNSDSYILSNPLNGQQVKVTVSSSGTSCTSRTSSSLIVNTKKAPKVEITPTKSTICPGENVSFSASPLNQGSTPTYQWFVNGTSVQNGSSKNLNNPTGLIEGDNTIKVVMTSSLTCVTTNEAEWTIDYTVKPIATIAATTTTDTESCINTAILPIKFDIGGGGTGATVSGLPSGISGSFSNGVYTISGSPSMAGIFNFTVNTVGTCEQTSATGSIKVNPNATLSLTSGNNNQTVCASGGVGDANIDQITYSIGETGTNANVTGLPTGISGSYSNGTFTISGASMVSGTHNYTVIATGTCGDSPPLTGSITINENLAPSVSITSSDADDEICDGESLTFTATPTNGGTNPQYQWRLNGNLSGAVTASNTFGPIILNNGDTVSAVLISSEICLFENNVNSDEISTKVNPKLEPAVSIVASDSEFCAGDEVIYTALVEDGGILPTYEWKIGSTVVGSGDSFKSSNLTNGQSITVTLTSNETCVTTSSVVSDPVITIVKDNLEPSVTIVSNDDNNILCSGGSITFEATATNGGTNPEYQWQINGNPSGGVTTSNTFGPIILNDKDIVSAVLISNEECLADNNVISNEIPVQVDSSIASETPQWDNIDLTHNPTAICPSVSGLKYKVVAITDATSYDWTLPSGWSITDGAGKNEITVTASVNAAAGNITVNGRSECGPTQSISLPVTTGTAAHVNAGPDQTVCPGTIEINLNGEIGGVITQKKDWNWSDNGAGGTFKNKQGSDLKGTYTIPSSLRNGGSVTIKIQSVKPAGDCAIKTDEMTLTIQSAAAITDPTNKNQTVCINSEITFIPFTISGAGTGATAIGLPVGVTGTFANGIFTLTGTPTEAGTFNYKVTTTGNCTNASRNGTLTVNPRPTFTQPVEVFVCAGIQTSTISFGGSSVSGTTYQWTNDNISIGLAASGTGDISSFTAVNTTNDPVIANIIVTPIANNCDGTTEEFQITVYPKAAFTAPENITACNGENLQEIVFAGSNVAGTNYKWINSNTSIGLGTQGTGNISSFTATNSTNETIVASITVTPVVNGCDGTAKEFTITVNPTPVFTTPENIIVCNGETFSRLDFAGETTTGTTYSWTNDKSSIGLDASGTDFIPSFTGYNNGNEPVIATITVTPSANDCEGEPVAFEITVNPTSIVNTVEDITVCNGEDLSELVLTSTVSGTTYSWINSNPAIGLAGSGTGNIPAFSAENNTEQAVTATISVTPTANECESTLLTFNITVNPNVIIEAGPNQTICSNGVATMSATLQGGASEGTWTTSGSGTFNNNFNNAEYTPSSSDALNGSVILTYTSNDPDGPCGPVSDTLELIINKEVVITTEPEDIGICSTEPSQLTVIASGDNLSYEWKRTDGANITNSNGIYSSTLSFNNTTSINAGKYYVVVRGEDACNDEDDPVKSAEVTIIVDENIIIEEPLTEIPICGDGVSSATMKYIAHANGADLLDFKWFKGDQEVVNGDDITIITGLKDENGRYEGTLTIKNITTADNGDYYVEITGSSEFTCPTAVTNPFQLRFEELPETPIIEDLTVCQFETPVAFSVIEGTNIRWYKNETDTDFITNEAGQPTAPTLSTDELGDFYYWATQKPEACESEKVQVKMTVNLKPGIPETQETDIHYCQSDSVNSFEISGSNLTWYSDENLQNEISEPTINTEVVGSNSYWVTQTNFYGTSPNQTSCESDSLEISVTVSPLPNLTATAEEYTICSGNETTLNVSNSTAGSTTYIWTVIEGTAIDPAESTNVSPKVSPITTTTYMVTGTSDKGCTSSAEVIVIVDEQSAGGEITPTATAVCISENSGTLSIAGSGYVGQIVQWEFSVDNWSTKTVVANTSETLTFSNLTKTTKYRAVVKNGVCLEVYSNIIEIQVYPKPAGGELNFANNVGRILVICENEQGSFGEDLILSGFTGEIVSIQYRTSTDISWNTMSLNIPNPSTTGTVVLTSSQLEGISMNETTIFRVETKSGPCLPNAFSKTAIVSVIPTDIEPTPVSVDPGVICLGQPVTLSSSTGYTNGPNIFSRGAFDNASITEHNWRVRRDNKPVDIGFDTDANNLISDRWKRATRHQFPIANTNSPYPASSQYISSQGPNASGNKGFGLITAKNPATLETPVFSIDGLDQALLVFDQFYNLTPGASIQVKISTDGGNSYPTTLYDRTAPSTVGDPGITSGYNDGFALGTVSTRPENKIQIDLGNYMGQSNLRIMFSYVGTRNGDVWAIDNIDVPDGPRDVGIIWTDYSDPIGFPDGEFIGNNDVEQWTPKLIGLNIFEVKTQIILNSKGASCQNIENAETVEVYVFDTYTSTATAVVGTCGDLDVQLTGTILGANSNNVAEVSVNPDGNFPLGDNSTAAWEVISGPAGYTYTFTPDVNANVTTFTPNLTGDYEIRYTITKDPNSPCTVTSESITFTIPDCTTLDFDGVDDYIDLGLTYTGTYSIEAWIRPESTNGTIISGPGYELSLVAGKPSFITSTGTIASTIGIAANSRWHHIAASSNGKLYVDGIEVASGTASTGGAAVRTLIGARKNSGTPENYFTGWIEEVRIWNKPITQDQIRFMMNQRLQNAANIGVEIPMPMPILIPGDELVYADLAGYYMLISRDPDPLGLGVPWGVTFAGDLMPANGLTPDLASASVPGRLHNMTTNQENTAPLPYISARDGQTWATDNTWLRPAVWDAPNSNGIDNSTSIDWNIVRTNHDIDSGNRDITVLGLKSETVGKLLNITGPGTQNENNPGQMLRVTHYLLLDGNIDLVGESQLLQDEGSILEEISKGWLKRDQQGTLSSFNYNYWTAPVSTQGAANNSGFTVRDIMWDGTDSKNPKTINYQASYPAADGAKTNPITKSDYWIFKFDNRLADDYDSWQHIGSTGFLKTGEGHTMKGVSGVGGVAAIAQKQNYVYRGKPNNGDITLTIDKDRNYLVGNPYPSALDSKKFILDNIKDSGGFNPNNVFDGTIYLWDHFSGATHILREYIGGYAVLNLFPEGVPAIATDDRINSTGELGKTPKQFIPVSQGFFVNSSKLVNDEGVVIFTPDGGQITFKNSQRFFERESGNSLFLKPETVTKTGKEEANIIVPTIRISFKSPKGYLRQLLVGAHPSTTNGFDVGYDAPMIEYNIEDMYWLQGGNSLVIQGVPDFGKEQVLPLGIRIDKAGDFTIKIDELKNMKADQNIYLKDILLDTIHDIRSGPYISTSEPGEITQRFQLIFHKETQQDPVVDEPIIIDEPKVDDLTEISLLHSYTENEMMVFNPQELLISAIYLYDMNGKLLSIFEDVPSVREIRLKVGNFSEGVYVLKMHTDTEIVTRKIIIKN